MQIDDLDPIGDGEPTRVDIPPAPPVEAPVMAADAETTQPYGTPPRNATKPKRSPAGTHRIARREKAPRPSTTRSPVVQTVRDADEAAPPAPAQAYFRQPVQPFRVPPPQAYSQRPVVIRHPRRRYPKREWLAVVVVVAALLVGSYLIARLVLPELALP